jgi:hypothetical protein
MQSLRLGPVQAALPVRRHGLSSTGYALLSTAHAPYVLPDPTALKDEGQRGHGGSVPMRTNHMGTGRRRTGRSGGARGVAEQGEAQIGPGDANALRTPMPALCCPLRRELRSQ